MHVNKNFVDTVINNLENDKKRDYVVDLITEKDSHEMLP